MRVVGRFEGDGTSFTALMVRFFGEFKSFIDYIFPMSQKNALCHVKIGGRGGEVKKIREKIETSGFHLDAVFYPVTFYSLTKKCELLEEPR